ncbi:hypothetical protein QIU18_10120 [Capnocytophaga canimorsus]|nr:hypothetical protein [Capnocytophaga canimorsus]WGU69917.1 hypothetical protein QIU18_10120 [Capnocytophaga canimorsus]
MNLKKGNYNCKIGYDKLLDLDNMVGELTIHFRWFKEMGGELEPWQKSIKTGIGSQKSRQYRWF